MRRVLGATTIAFVFLIGTIGTASAEQVQLSTELSGANEVGDPGHPDGTGSAIVDIDSDTNEVCFQITHSGIEEPVAAHIHQAASDANGDVVVDFDWATTAGSGCVAGDPAVVSAILADPSGFYVNVHTPDFGAGAIRGQLAGSTATLAQTGTNLTLILFVAGAAFIAVGGMLSITVARTRR